MKKLYTIVDGRYDPDDEECCPVELRVVFREQKDTVIPIRNHYKLCVGSRHVRFGHDTEWGASLGCFPTLEMALEMGQEWLLGRGVVPLVLPT